jgi:ATP-dependent 26S proteasome regulatory subunit
MSRPTNGSALQASFRHQVPETFTKVIQLHLYRNLHPRPERGSPLILGVHGPSGEGKTYQCVSVIQQLGVRMVMVSGGLLESPDAGRPAELLREAYQQASLLRAKHGTPAVVLVNDIDTAVGDWGPMVQTTVNRQIVFEELMNLADLPTEVEGRVVHRSPVILTGNDFTKLYAPLMRFGRMTMFMWRPGMAEKAQILEGIFPELTVAECAELVRRFPGQPIAFFAQLRPLLQEEAIWGYLKQVGAVQTLQDLLSGRVPEVRDNLSLDTLSAAGSALLKRHSLVNHLES